MNDTNVIPLQTTDSTANVETQQPERHVVKRNVVVIMPFGSETGTERSENGMERQSILDLMRIKYIIEKLVEVTPEGGLENDPKIEYDVNIFREPVGSVPEGAVDTVVNADVLIALLTTRNVNVIYELAIRNLLKDEPILIVNDESADFLPVYLKDMAYIRYDHPDSSAVIEQTTTIAESKYPELTWKKTDQIPEALQQAIDAGDYLEEELSDALQKLENNKQRPPHFLRKHVIDLDPGHVMSPAWSTYTPFSVVRIKWQRKRGDKYDPTDMIGTPVIYEANNDYFRMFDLEGGPDAPDPDGESALIVSKMIERLKDYIEPQHYEKFKEDQDLLAEKIILNDRIWQAKVPMQFNDKHEAYANQIYLPSMIGKRVVGSPQSPHVVFLAIAFIKEFLPLPDTLENTESNAARTGAG